MGGVTTETRRTGERAEVTIRHRSDLERLLRSRRPLDWELAIPGRVPVALEVRTGASQVRLDLSRTAVDSVTVKAGASDVDLILPASGRCRVRVDAGAADVEVRVPPGVAAGIRTRSALASVDVDEHRFPRNSDGYRSADYDGAEHRADIELEGGVASFSVR